MSQTSPVSATTPSLYPSLLHPTNLRCEYLENPIGIGETQPRLSWALASDERDQHQSAYQLQVSSHPQLLEGDLWDSGRVASSESLQVVYAGQPLRSRQRCHWRVRVWDGAGNISDWSAVAYWELATKKGTAVSLVPEKTLADDIWRSGGVFFSPKSSLLAWRGESKDEVPEKTLETDVPAERRGVVRIDLRDKKVIPLNMGQSACTMTCVIDPTGTWLATGGLGHRDNATKKDMWTGELRVYHLPTGKLAFREQVDGYALKWLAFTPSGKRIVTSAGDGVVRWWDVQE